MLDEGTQLAHKRLIFRTSVNIFFFTYYNVVILICRHVYHVQPTAHLIIVCLVISTAVGRILLNE